MNIKWKGVAGYGDIVTPLCYAINQNQIKNKTVNLEFIWKNNVFNNDLELLIDRVDFIYKKLNYKGIKLYHSFVNTLTTDYKTNYEFNAIQKEDIFHNIYFPKWDVNPIYDVVCSPLFNKVPLRDYGYNKAWKDGLTFEQWDDLVYMRKYNNIHVDYRTPIKELFEILSQCRYFIGYHGSVAWVARLFKIPMTIYSQDKEYTKWVFPWSADTEEESLALLNDIEGKRNEYIEHLRGS